VNHGGGKNLPAARNVENMRHFNSLWLYDHDAYRVPAYAFRVVQPIAPVEL
jgi:hypothetical protein